jgi:hypothetical protein
MGVRRLMQHAHEAGCALALSPAFSGATSQLGARTSACNLRLPAEAGHVVPSRAGSLSTPDMRLSGLHRWQAGNTGAREDVRGLDRLADAWLKMLE